MSDWGKHGDSTKHKRYKAPAPKASRRRCSCGCKQRAAFVGMANGVALVSGCELRIRRWVKTGKLVLPSEIVK